MYNNKAVHTVHMILSVYNWDEMTVYGGMNNKWSKKIILNILKTINKSSRLNVSLNLSLLLWNMEYARIYIEHMSRRLIYESDSIWRGPDCYYSNQHLMPNMGENLDSMIFHTWKDITL